MATKKPCKDSSMCPPRPTAKMPKGKDKARPTPKNSFSNTKLNKNNAEY